MKYAQTPLIALLWLACALALPAQAKTAPAFQESPSTLRLDPSPALSESLLEEEDAPPEAAPPAPALTEGQERPPLSYEEGAFSLRPLLGSGEAAAQAAAPGSAGEKAPPAPNLHLGGSATVKMEDQLDLSLGYLAGHSATPTANEPLTGLEKDPINQQQINVKMKLRF